MPAHRHINRRLFLQRFLYFVLADIVQTNPIRRFDRVRTVSLGNRDDGDLLSVAASSSRSGNSAPHIGYSLSQARKSHSVQI